MHHELYWAKLDWSDPSKMVRVARRAVAATPYRSTRRTNLDHSGADGRPARKLGLPPFAKTEGFDKS
jgi:hypothetical protein